MEVKVLQCRYCETEMKETVYANYSLRCPKCHRVLRHLSDYGFGPVTPFHICVGSEVVGIVEENSNKYQLNFRGKNIELTKTYFEAVHEGEEYVADALGIKLASVEFPVHFGRCSLYVYGESFEAPYENDHKIKNIHFDGELLIITFKDREELFVYHPKDVVSTERELRIQCATKVSYNPYGAIGKEGTQTYQYCDGKIRKKNRGSESVLAGSESEPAVLLEKW